MSFPTILCSLQEETFIALILQRSPVVHHSCSGSRWWGPCPTWRKQPHKTVPPLPPHEPAVTLSAVVWHQAVAIWVQLLWVSHVDCHSFICFSPSRPCCNFLPPAVSAHTPFSLSNYLCFVPYLSFYIKGGKSDEKILPVNLSISTKCCLEPRYHSHTQGYPFVTSTPERKLTRGNNYSLKDSAKRFQYLPSITKTFAWLCFSVYKMAEILVGHTR